MKWISAAIAVAVSVAAPPRRLALGPHLSRPGSPCRRAQRPRSRSSRRPWVWRVADGRRAHPCPVPGRHCRHVEGWTATATPDGAGNSVLEWTGGVLPADEEGAFPVEFTAPDTPGVLLTFPAIQVCENGEELAWISGDPADEYPAPRVLVLPPGSQPAATIDDVALDAPDATSSSPSSTSTTPTPRRRRRSARPRPPPSHEPRRADNHCRARRSTAPATTAAPDTTVAGQHGPATTVGDDDGSGSGPIIAIAIAVAALGAGAAVFVARRRSA